MLFGTKNYLKNNRYYTSKHPPTEPRQNQNHTKNEFNQE